MRKKMSNASDTFAKIVLLRGQEYKKSSQSRHMLLWVRIESKLNGLRDLEVLNITRRNTTKRLKIRTIRKTKKPVQAIIIK